MNRPHRSIEIFTMSALDLFVTAMGSFAILMMILFPYFRKESKQRAEERQGCVLMCAWPTRVKDYEQFKKETEAPGKKQVRAEDRARIADEDSWKEPGYEQGPDFPVVMVSWTEAADFCAWLTKKESAANLIPPGAAYRLPTVEEWRFAVGAEKYPWGETWPPPPKTGNLGGDEFARGLGLRSGDLKGYEDAHELAAPVGSYAASRDGLYDLSGNIHVWTQDWYRKELAPKNATADDGGGQKFRAYAGSAWDSVSQWEFEADSLLASVPEGRVQTLGFRCVLVLPSPPKK